MIEIQGLKKSYGTKLVLDGVHLTVPDGAKFGLVGINGAGKSTLLRLIADVLRPDEGSILLDGECVTGNAKKREELFFLPDDPYYASGTDPVRYPDSADPCLLPTANRSFRHLSSIP